MSETNLQNIQNETDVRERVCRRLYEEDAFITDFEAEVTAVSVSGKGQAVLELNRTAFYPEGGGQAADTGRITCGDTVLHIIDVQEKEGHILHYVEMDNAEEMDALAGIRVGTPAAGQIDWADRFDRMQNHSGEHIVSGLVHKHYGYENVGFHMGKDFTVIDFSGPLTMEQLLEIEQEANALIWKDVNTDIRIYSQEEIRQVTYRSKKELTGQVRVVTFPEGDVCACCGTHVRSTGQIGVIKIFSCVPFHDGVRVEMLCGRRAYEYLAAAWQQNHEVSVALSARPLETGKAVAHTKKVLADTTYRMISLQEQLLQAKAEALTGAGSLALFEEGYSPELVRKECAAVLELCGGMALVFSGDDENGYKYAIGQKDGDLRQLVKEMNAALDGRGGGKPFFAQGSVKAARKDIEEWLSRFCPDIRLSVSEE